MTSSVRDLKVYTTYPHACSYLEGKEAVTLFVDPRTPVDQALYSRLSTIGFRRSGSHVYRPHCTACNACIPARVRTADFEPTRRQRRISKRNSDLLVQQTSSINDPEAFDLYCRYIEHRHYDGDMYPPDREQFESFLSDEWGVTDYFRFYDGTQLLAVAVVDRLQDGLSAIYTFFDPEAAPRSLGVHAVLWQIERARELGLPYVYLGYWIKDCQKMAYKAEYHPLELYMDNQWGIPAPELL